MEAFTLGVAISFYDNIIVLQALWDYIYLAPLTLPDSLFRLITIGVFFGLTLFTLQSKVRFDQSILCLLDNILLQYDFSGMGPFLFGSLFAFGLSVHPFMSPYWHYDVKSLPDSFQFSSHSAVPLILFSHYWAVSYSVVMSSTILTPSISDYHLTSTSWALSAFTSSMYSSSNFSSNLTVYITTFSFINLCKLFYSVLQLSLTFQ